MPTTMTRLAILQPTATLRITHMRMPTPRIIPMRMPIATPRTIPTRMPIATPWIIATRTPIATLRITLMRMHTAMLRTMPMTTPKTMQHTAARHMELFTTTVLPTTHTSTLTGSTQQFTAMPSMQLTLLLILKNSIR